MHFIQNNLRSKYKNLKSIIKVMSKSDLWKKQLILHSIIIKNINDLFETLNKN